MVVADPSTGVVAAPAAPSPHDRVRAGVAALGLGLTGAGIAAVFTSNGGAGSAALVVLGSLMVLVGAFGDQLQSMREGNLELLLHQRAAEAKAHGDFETAKVLERAAHASGANSARVARARNGSPVGTRQGPEPGERMNAIIAEARGDAYASDLDAEELLRTLWTGSQEARVWALGVLQERPELATTRAVLEAVERPDQMFDEYYALTLADLFVQLPSTEPWARQRVIDAVRSQVESGSLKGDRDCNDLALQILTHTAMEHVGD